MRRLNYFVRHSMNVLNNGTPIIRNYDRKILDKLKGNVPMFRKFKLMWANQISSQIWSNDYALKQCLFNNYLIAKILVKFVECQCGILLLIIPSFFVIFPKLYKYFSLMFILLRRLICLWRLHRSWLFFDGNHYFSAEEEFENY